MAASAVAIDPYRMHFGARASGLRSGKALDRVKPLVPSSWAERPRHVRSRCVMLGTWVERETELRPPSPAPYLSSHRSDSTSLVRVSVDRPADGNTLQPVDRSYTRLDECSLVGAG